MESWFSNARVVRLPAEYSWVGWLTEGRGGGVVFTWMIPMTACLKIVAYRHTKQVSGGGLDRAAARGTPSHSRSHVVDQGASMLPVKNEITLTGGRLSKLLIFYWLFTTAVVHPKQGRGVLNLIDAGVLCFQLPRWFMWGENHMFHLYSEGGIYQQKKYHNTPQVNCWDLKNGNIAKRSLMKTLLTITMGAQAP